MEIRNGKLHLSQDDIENIISNRIKEIQDKLDDSYYKIKNGEMSPRAPEITMLDEKNYAKSDFMGSYEEFKDEQIISFVKKYVTAMKNNKRIPPSVFDFLKRTVKKNAIEPDEARPDWLDKLENGMKMADEYAQNRADAIVTDNRNFYIPAVIERCLSYIEEERAANTVRAPQVKTNWQTLFKKFKEYNLLQFSFISFINSIYFSLHFTFNFFNFTVFPFSISLCFLKYAHSFIFQIICESC